jgi:hypothetical protein
MRVRLTQKLAERVDGIDLTGVAVGDVLELPDRQALCLILEGWATAEPPADKISSDARPELAAAANPPQQRRRNRRGDRNASRV